MPEVERKVSQLDSDVHEIYEMLRQLTANVNDMGARILRQESRLNQIESDLQGLAEVQGGHTATLAEHGQKLDRIIALLSPDS